MKLGEAGEGDGEFIKSTVSRSDGKFIEFAVSGGDREFVMLAISSGEAGIPAIHRGISMVTASIDLRARDALYCLRVLYGI